MSLVPSAPPLYPALPAECEGLAKTYKNQIRHCSFNLKGPIPNLGGGRLGGQGNMFVDQLFKLKYGPEKFITFTVSFTYNAPIFSLKIKVTEGAKLLNENDVRIQFSYTSASGKRKGVIIEDLDNESLKSEEGHVALRTNTPESRFRAIFFKDQVRWAKYIDWAEEKGITEIQRKMLTDMKPFNSSGNRFFQKRKEVTYTMNFWLRIVPNRSLSLHCKKFQNLNQMLFLNRECSGDLKVNCQGILFDCHKLVLSCQSDVFCTMFNSRKWQMLESKTGEVKIHDVKPEVMETLIYYIYHDAVQDEMKINCELLIAADKYNILGLLDVCAGYLEANLSLENGLDIMISAYLTNQKSLFAAASTFVCENKGELIKSDFWNSMLKSNPELIGKAFNQAIIVTH